MRKNRAQSTLEYLLVMSAIVGIIIYAAAAWIRPGVNTALTSSWSVVDTAAGKLDPP